MQITINGKVYEANDSDYLLEVARANNVFIPAICYLGGCSPTLACRMCMVEVDGKRVYACNTKIKEGMVVETNTKDLWDERNAIMQTYCINHPLQCGVCDKSGECELQNFTHKARVDTQEHYIKEIDRRHKDFGVVQYDPSLCIVCERCITVCKDKIGENALKTIARGGEAPDKSFKDTMGKDSYAVWTKFQKSLIAPANGDELDCSGCGECTSVCPTGALITKHFQYKSNAWELKRIPASNPHSSDCELMYYDVKQTSIKDQSPKIYRVSNDFHFASLDRAARFGFDFESVGTKDEKAFFDMVELFKSGKVKNVIFNSFITNEEAYILELLRQKYGFNLVNEEARAFKEFCSYYALEGELYNATSDDVKNADFIVCAGSFLRHDAPQLGYKVNNALVINKGAGLYFHPVNDKKVDNFSKNFLQINHKAGLEAYVLLFILQYFGEDIKDECINSLIKNAYYEADKEVEESVEVEELVKEKQKQEDGSEIEVEVVKKVKKKVKKTIKVQKSTFAKELGFDDEKMADLLMKKSNFVLILGSDFIFSKDKSMLAKLATNIQKHTKFKVFVIPTHTNTLGVSTICNLSKKEEGFSFGYNERADFSFSYDEHHDLISSALNQQEGTFVNYDKNVVPTNAALPFKGYFLNDLANALGFDEEYTINYTKKLPISNGFRGIDFDELDNYYDNGGKAHRGYTLTSDIKNAFMLESDDSYEVKCELDIKENQGQICLANPIGNSSKITNKCRILQGVARLYASEKFLNDNGLNDGDMIRLKNEQKSIIIRVEKDKDISNMAYLPTFDEKLNAREFFKQSRYINVEIEKI